MPEQLYELRIVASGTVRDAEGNIVNNDLSLEGTQVVSESEMKEIKERLGQ